VTQRAFKRPSVYKTLDALRYYFATCALVGDIFREQKMARVEIVAAVLTISDSASRGEREDRSGPAVIAEVEKLGGRVAAAEIVSDDLDLISAKVREFADRGDVNLILTTGGTGFAPRDNTPEATRAVIEREAPGLAELMRYRSLDETPLAPLSRAVCGIRGRTLIVNLPGSTRGAVQNFTAIRSSLPHAIGLIDRTIQEVCYLKSY
jgi:molybdenum cofactor synthesis domain-containing protein